MLRTCTQDNKLIASYINLSLSRYISLSPCLSDSIFPRAVSLSLSECSLQAVLPIGWFHAKLCRGVGRSGTGDGWPLPSLPRGSSYFCLFFPETTEPPLGPRPHPGTPISIPTEDPDPPNGTAPTHDPPACWTCTLFPGYLRKGAASKAVE